MKVHQFRQSDTVSGKTVLTIGNFDGVHLGHQALIRKVVGEARESGSASAVLTFDPHPQQVLNTRTVPILTGLALRLRLFGELGVDRAYIIPFTRELAAKSAEEFLTEYLLGHFQILRMIIGYDFAFGRNRAGTAAVLEKISQREGFHMEVFPAVALGEEIVSSTRIRSALAVAEFDEAARFLGRDFSVLAEVERGQQRGHGLGFPTINQPARDPLPIPFGVYASLVKLQDRTWHGVTNYGQRPTVGGGAPILETHLFGFAGDAYGASAEVIPLRRLREERQFPSLDALKAQIAEDCRQARDFLDEIA